MKTRVFEIVVLFALFLSACGPTPALDNKARLTSDAIVEKEAVAAEMTLIARPTTTPAPTLENFSATSPIGSAKLEQGTLRGNPGDEWGDVIMLTTTGADQFVFPGYICETSEDPYGIGGVTTSSGGIDPNTSQSYGIKIWEDSKPGSCTERVTVWLYKGDQKYVLDIPIKIVVQ